METLQARGMGGRGSDAGVLGLLDDPGRQARLGRSFYLGAVAAGVVAPAAMWLWGEALAALIGGSATAAYVVGYFVVPPARDKRAFLVLAYATLIGTTSMTVVLGGLVWSGGVLFWGLPIAALSLVFLGRSQAAWIAGLFATSGLLLAALDGVLRGRRDVAPEPALAAFLAGLVFLGGLGFVFPVVSALLAQLRAENRRTRSLMLNTLPVSVVDRLKADEQVVDALPAVTTLFADIVGFTAASASMSPDEIVDALNEVFIEFDAIAARHRLEKIKTIGDGYHAVAGAPEPREDHLQCAADAALEMVTVCDGRSYGGVPLRVRIGMDTGPVVAAVIGTSKFSYDLWGDSVNTAARMESHGEPGRIHVTAAVREGLGESYRFTARGPVEVKSKGTMETFFLDGSAS